MSDAAGESRVELGSWRWWRGRGEAEGVVDGFNENGDVDRLVDVGDRSSFESGIAVADGSA